MRTGGLALIFVLTLARVAAADFDGLLHHARTQNLDGVRMLLEQGSEANPPHAWYRGYTPLMFAAGNGDAEMTRLLLEAGASTELRDHNGERALEWAARRSFLRPFSDNAESARLLLEAGSPADSDEDRYGSSPLIAVNSYGADPQMVRHLLAAGADVNRADRSGRTALYGAAGTERGVETVRLLLAAGADPNIRVDHLDQTPLHRAALSAGPGTIGLLTEAGAIVDARQSEGETALFVAAGRGDVGDVAMLLSLGGDPDAQDNAGLTPLLAAITARYGAKLERGHAEVALLLANRTADIDRAFAASLWAGMGEVARRLHERGANANAVDHLGRSALAGAVSNFDVSWYQTLVAEGADLGRFGGEVLGEAGRRGSGAMLRHFLDLDVPVDARDGSGMTALLHAARRGHAAAVRFLLERGADSRVRDARALGAADHMERARALLEDIIARAEASRAMIDVSVERAELARLQAAHAQIIAVLAR